MKLMHEQKQARSGISVRNADSGTAARSGAGFTLIEVLLALAVFSIGLLAVAGMQTSSVTRNTSSKMNTMAVEYASDYMERLLAMGADKDLADPLGYAPLQDSGGAWYTPGEFVGLDYDGDGVDDVIIHTAFDELFDLSWRVEDITAATDVPGFSAATAGTVKRITVRVSWRNREITLTSMKSVSL